MMWALAMNNKIKAAVLLCIVLSLVILTNFGERRNVAKINTAITSIYEDRLVVEGYIFQLSRHLEKIDDLIASDHIAKVNLVNLEIKEIELLNGLYAKTQLTEVEKNSFNKFTQLCENLSRNNNGGYYTNLKLDIKDAEEILHTLSSIQMEEAKAQMDNVSSISNFSNMMSHFELIILVIITIIIQFLLLSARIRTVKMPAEINLN